MTKSPSLPYSHENKSPALNYQRGGGSPHDPAPFAQEDSFNRSLQSALDKLGSVQYGSGAGDISVQYGASGAGEGSVQYGGGDGSVQYGGGRAGEVGTLRVRTQFENRDETASPPRMSEREKTL